jgi:hypothetical protein
MQVETLKNKKQNVEKWQRFDTITFLFVAKQSGSPHPHTAKQHSSIEHDQAPREPAETGDCRARTQSTRTHA